MALRVILLHGTRPPWTRRSLRKCLRKVPYDYAEWAGLRQHLATAFHEDGIEIQPAFWDGKNSHRSRRRAAGDLRAVLLTRLHPRSTEVLFVLAHSHGGNVALRAAAGLQGSLGGIVCFATPVLTASNEVGSILPKSAVSRWWTLTLTAGLLFVNFVPQVRPAAGVMIGGFGALLVGAITMMAYFNAKQVAEDLEPKFVELKRQFFVTASRDEAWNFLGTFAFVGTLGNTLIDYVARLSGAVRSRGIGWNGASIAVFATAMLAAIGTLTLTRDPSRAAPAFWLAQLVILTAGVSTLFVLAGLMCGLFASLAYGIQVGLAVPFINLSTTFPPGEAPDGYNLQGRRFVSQHSYSYQSPEAHAAVETWMRTRCAEVSRERADSKASAHLAQQRAGEFERHLGGKVP
jgi:hypothetical protein